VPLEATNMRRSAARSEACLAVSASSTAVFASLCKGGALMG